MFLRDKPVLCHALNDVKLANAGAFGVADGVVCRGCLGKPCQHGCLGNRDIFEGLAKIDFAGGCKAISAMTQKNLVHVDFKNLFFGQKMF
ncbi:hypothetical protein D3C72_2057540 [compost metagenome]